jgi:hypothetical protein
MAWFTLNPITWFKRYIKAWWDALFWKWDDTVLPWDALSKNEWKTDNPVTWFTKN